MDWLNNLLAWTGLTGGMSTQQPKDPAAAGAPVPTAAPTPKPTSAMQSAGGSTSAGGNPATSGAMGSDFAKLLAATLLATPQQHFPGAVAPPRQTPFVYSPVKYALMNDPRQGLARY